MTRPSDTVGPGRRSLRQLIPALPALIFLTGFFLVPLGLMVVLSFTQPTAGLANYASIFESQANRRALVNSFVICLQATLVTGLLGSALLWALVSWKSRWRGLVWISLLLPFVTSGELVRILAWLVALSPDGFLGRMLVAIGLLDQGSVIVPGRTAILIGLVHILLPFFTLTAYSALRMMDRRLPQAARSLGAPRLQAFLTTTLPLAMGPLVGASLLVFVIALGYYATPAALGGQTDLVLPTLITNQVQGRGNWGMGAALGTCLLVLTSLLLVALMRFGGFSVLVSGGADRKVGVPGRLSAGFGDMAASRAVRRLGLMVDAVPGVAPVFKALRSAVVALCCAYLAIPLAVAIPASFSESTILGFPPRGFSTRWYAEFAADPAWNTALTLSVGVGVATAIVSLLLGVGISYVVARGPRAWRMPLFVFGMLPMVMPWTVTALGLYFQSVMIGVAYQPIGLVIGHAVGGVPYVMVVLVTALTAFDWRLDVAAKSLGAGSLRRVKDVALPLLRPAILGALLFAFIWSFTEVIFAYLMNDPPVQTLPVAMWQELTYNITPVVAAAGGVLTGALAVIFAGYGVARAVGTRQRARRERPTPSGRRASEREVSLDS